MVETDVELILSEIRDRVRATPKASSVAANDVGSSAVARNALNGVSTTETVDLINSYLTTTARSWDQFPPLVSNRKGVSASVELWLKRFFRRGTRWYVWEQVNFNAAIHHALRDLLPVILLYQNELETLRAEIVAANGLRQVELENIQRELEARRAENATRAAQVEAALRALGNANTEVQLQLKELPPQLQGLQLQLKELVAELRERDDHIREEQRVCFKQVALETSEAAILEDRSRHKTETLLAELQRRIEEIEKKK